jgi:hypothetical protein
MKTTLDLPDDLIRQAKLRAIVQGRTLRDLMADFIRQGLGLVPNDANAKLQASPDAESAIEIGSNGIPVFRCLPHAGKKAKPASANELLKLEQQILDEGDLLHVGHPV